VPTPISHAAVGFAIAAWTQQRPPTRQVCLVAAACAALPDIDVIGAPLHLADASLFAHRAITHSLVFAVLAAAVATLVFFRSPQWTQRRARIAVILGLALLSHGCLDALSRYSWGVEFFAPFSQQRFRFPWTPLGDPNGDLAGQLAREAIVVLLPAVVLAWLAFRVRDRAASAQATSG
jgi:inner membrane protein